MCQPRDDDHAVRAAERASPDFNRLSAGKVRCPRFIDKLVAEFLLLSEAYGGEFAAELMGLKRTDCHGYRARMTQSLSRHKIISYCVKTGHNPRMLAGIPQNAAAELDQALKIVGREGDEQRLAAYQARLSNADAKTLPLAAVSLDMRQEAFVVSLRGWLSVPCEERAARCDLAETHLEGMRDAADRRDAVGFESYHRQFHIDLIHDQRARSLAEAAIRYTVEEHARRVSLDDAVRREIIDTHTAFLGRLRSARNTADVEQIEASSYQSHAARRILLSA